MKKIISALLLVVILFSTTTALTSCAKDDNGAQISVYLTDRVYSFDPAANVLDDSVIQILQMIYEPLFSIKSSGTIEKAMAKKYKWDRNTGDLIIELKESYWSDGSRVKAGDFLYAWRRIIDPTNNFSCASLLYDVKNALKIKTGVDGYSVSDLGVYADSTETLRISFEDTNVNRKGFLRNLASISLAPVSADAILNRDSYWHSTTSATYLYCNGPFRVKDLDNAQGYFTLSRNNGYHRSADSKKAVDYFVVPELLRTAWELDDSIYNEEIENMQEAYNLMSVKAENTVFYMSQLPLSVLSSAKKVKSVDAMSTYTYLFNTENSLVSSSAVRTILSNVLDREAIANIMVYGKAATGLVNNKVWNATLSWKSQSFRKKSSNLLSTNASMSIDEAKTQLTALHAQKGTLTITCQQSEVDIAVAEYIKGVWSQLGYTIEVNPVSYYTVDIETGGLDKNTNEPLYSSYHVSALQTIYDKKSFDVIAIDYQMFSTNALGALAPMSYLYSGAGVDLDAMNLSTNKDVSNYIVKNAANYRNDAYDALILQAINEKDLKKRSEYLRQAEEILIGDMPLIPLVFNQHYYVKSSKLTGLKVDYFGYTSFTKAKLSGYKKYFLY